MRKNIAEVIDAWIGRGVHQEKTCRTDGYTIWSYQTPIAHRDSDGTVFVVDGYLSATTNCQILAIMATLTRRGVEVKRVPSIEVTMQSTVTIGDAAPQFHKFMGSR